MRACKVHAFLVDGGLTSRPAATLSSRRATCDARGFVMISYRFHPVNTSQTCSSTCGNRVRAARVSSNAAWQVQAFDVCTAAVLCSVSYRLPSSYALASMTTADHLLHAAVHRIISSGRRGRQRIQQVLRHVRAEWAARHDTACRLGRACSHLRDRAAS